MGASALACGDAAPVLEQHISAFKVTALPFGPRCGTKLTFTILSQMTAIKFVKPSSQCQLIYHRSSAGFCLLSFLLYQDNRNQHDKSNQHCRDARRDEQERGDTDIPTLPVFERGA